LHGKTIENKKEKHFERHKIRRVTLNSGRRGKN